MKPITFNKYINRIGIEFEGFYTRPFALDIMNMGLNIDSDASLKNEWHDCDTYEVTTPPCTSGKLSDFLAIWAVRAKTNDYRINSTVGLHYHISLNKQYYYYIMQPDFFRAYHAMFKEHFPIVFKDRDRNRYSYGTPRLKELDLICRKKPRTSLDRDPKYSFIYYQYNALKTAEFRAYGGEYATIEGLSDCIQKTIDLIKHYIESQPATPPIVQRYITNVEKEKFTSRYLIKRPLKITKVRNIDGVKVVTDESTPKSIYDGLLEAEYQKYIKNDAMKARRFGELVAPLVDDGTYVVPMPDRVTPSTYTWTTSDGTGTAPTDNTQVQASGGTGGGQNASGSAGFINEITYRGIPIIDNDDNTTI